MLEELAQLGFDDKEARFYLAILRSDHLSVSEAAAMTGVNRTTGYDLTKRLLRRGLVSQVESARPGQRPRTELVATDPAVLLSEWEETRQVLRSLVPELRALHPKIRTRPRSRYFEGVNGVRYVLQETLDWGGQLCAILSMRDLYDFPGMSIIDEYVAERIARKLPLLVIRSREFDIRPIWQSESSDFRSVRFAPSEYAFNMSIIMGDSASAFVSSAGERFALLIDSEEMASTMRNLFDVLWRRSASAS